MQNPRKRYAAEAAKDSRISDNKELGNMAWIMTERFMEYGQKPQQRGLSFFAGQFIAIKKRTLDYYRLCGF